MEMEELAPLSEDEVADWVRICADALLALENARQACLAPTHPPTPSRSPFRRPRRVAGRKEAVVYPHPATVEGLRQLALVRGGETQSVYALDSAARRLDCAAQIVALCDERPARVAQALARLRALAAELREARARRERRALRALAARREREARARLLAERALIHLAEQGS